MNTGPCDEPPSTLTSDNPAPSLHLKGKSDQSPASNVLLTGVRAALHNGWRMKGWGAPSLLHFTPKLPLIPSLPLHNSCTVTDRPPPAPTGISEGVQGAGNFWADNCPQPALLQRSWHWTATRAVVQLPWPGGHMRWKRNFIWLSHHRQIVPFSFSSSCLRRYHFNLLWHVVRTKRVQSVASVGTLEMVFYARLVFNGAHMW